MNFKKHGHLVSILAVLLLLVMSGCASEKEPNASEPVQPKLAEADPVSDAAEEEEEAEPQKEVPGVVEQTPAPESAPESAVTPKPAPTLKSKPASTKEQNAAPGKTATPNEGSNKGKVVPTKNNAATNPPAAPQKESDKGVVTENPQDILENYMKAIASQNVEAIAGLYGGSYQGISNLFPDTAPGDKRGLLKQYLETGSKISLETIVSRSEVSKGVYTFVVTFKNEDGTRFQTREFDTITETFTYTVKAVEGKLKVMELPPYQA